jgi:tRNA(Ile)-lysidine synthase
VRTKLPKAKAAKGAKGSKGAEALPLDIVPRTRRVLVGVSGGMDSTALVHALVGAGYGKLVLVHLNHGLRGKDSDGDAAFVKRLGMRLGLQVIVGRVDVVGMAKTRKESMETAAREARYAFFAEAARAARCRTLVLAHHADDQAETFLFNLLRGGGTGLGGMRRRTVRTVEGVELEILRPWLGVWRSKIEEVVGREKIKYREDGSNASMEHARNRMRKRVLPMLAAEFGRDVRPGLWRAAEIFAAQQEWLAGTLEVAGAKLSVLELRALPEALQRHAIYEWLRRRRVGEVSFALVEAIRGMLPEGAATAKVNLPGARHARRRGGVLFVE